jgi:hypothetical protein
MNRECDVSSTEYRQNHYIKMANSCFDYVAKFKYLGTTVTDQNFIHEEIKSRLNSGNAYYNSVQNVLSSRLLSKKVKIMIYKTIIFTAVFYGCKTWSLALREEYRQKVFGNRVLRRIFVPKGNEVTGG